MRCYTFSSLGHVYRFSVARLGPGCVLLARSGPLVVLVPAYLSKSNGRGTSSQRGRRGRAGPGFPEPAH
jgi:hypothetical protein